MKKLLFLIGMVLIISCTKEEMKPDEEIDFTDLPALLKLITGEWKELGGDQVYIFNKDHRTYKYCFNGKDHELSEDGTYTLTAATKTDHPIMKLTFTGRNNDQINYEISFTDYYNGFIEMWVDGFVFGGTWNPAYRIMFVKQ